MALQHTRGLSEGTEDSARLWEPRQETPSPQGPVE